MKLRAWLGTLVLATSAHAAPPDQLEPDDLAVPGSEVTTSAVKLDLPAVPAFDLPAPPGDGSYTIKELRVHGEKVIDTEIVVRGVVTWAYDCKTQLRHPGETDREVQKRIDDDPTLCERPKFYVGDTAQTPPDKSLWVVDVPRPYNRMEVANIPRAERTAPDRCEPNDPKAKVCPPYKVGDVVVIAGAFKQASPHSERNSDGLLVYERMANTTQHWESAGGVPHDRVHVALPAASPVPSRPASVPAKPMRKVVDAQTKAASMTHANRGSKEAGGKRYDVAVTEYNAALAAWDGNHLAWYGLGGAFAMTAKWAEASEAFAHAVQLRPDVAMYQMWHGITLYEKAVQGARADQARARNLKPEEVSPDLTAINFDPALQHLILAAALDDRMWRAHYYLGKIARAGRQPKLAAEEFTRAIARDPRQSGSYVALGELYRKWDYTDEAIKLEQQGAPNVLGDAAADVWYELGMGYDDKHLDAQAIDAFGKALELRPTHHTALFQRGQAYFRKGDLANAKQDLELYAKSSTADGFAKQQASKMLMDIASKHR